MAKNQFKIISLGGSIIIPPEGFNIQFLKQFRDLILNKVKKGEKFILITGGGSICRQYQKTAKEVASITDKEADWLGIAATRFNARFVQHLFGKYVHNEIIKDPTRKIKTSKSIIVGGGWKPGCSTDYDAVLVAKTYGSKELINATNINCIYTADPKIDPNAQPLQNLTWQDLEKIVSKLWKPGANVPFDPKAIKGAKKLGIKMSFVKGLDLQQFDAVLSGKSFGGTVVQ